MRYYIIAGEASGDLHASNLMAALRKEDPEAVFRCWGGDKMESQGGELVKHYRDLAFMGFAEVVAHLPEIMRNFSFCEKDILAFRPDLLILVDYPGFNLRIARFARKAGLRVVYYISPQLWAWRPSRVKTIQSSVDKMLVILPFEKDFYLKYGYEAEFVGHPLLDVINDEQKFMEKNLFFQQHGLDDRPVVALLPGSRKMEVAKMLKVMISVRRDFRDFQFVVAGAPSLDYQFYQEILSGTDVKFVKNQTYDLLHYSRAALVTSGTATLETALMEVPQVVCYKGSALSFAIAKRIVNIEYISLVNLISGKKVVTELIQQMLTREHLQKELALILYEGDARKGMLDDYRRLKELLGGGGASARAAASVTQYLKQSTV